MISNELAEILDAFELLNDNEKTILADHCIEWASSGTLSRENNYRRYDAR